mgnify:CR=1 FL=1|tara:strand:- start:1060 stop:1431 length:372 start_codon:yes stop_codon:yes gene_type:complete
MKHAINWFEIPVLDLNRAQKFYESLMDGSMHNMDMGESKMAIFPSDWMEGAVGGSIFHGEGIEPSTKGTTVYLNGGEDLSPYLARVESAGGQIILPKTAIGESGYIALFIDTEGNRVGLHSPQ